MAEPEHPQDWTRAWRERLRRESGPDYWRSLDELADTEEFRTWAKGEFPAAIFERGRGLERREFLKLMAAALMLAGLPACGPGSKPPDHIVPHVRDPEHAVPGRPVFYATTLTRSGHGLGVVVETHDGRPTKVEGNPAHPSSLGATDIFAQAEALALYDPDRSAEIRGPDGVASWEHLARALDARREELLTRQGRGLHLLTGDVSSPTLLHEIARLREQFPRMHWHVHEPVSLANERVGLAAATGSEAMLVPHLATADVIVALDADPFFSAPGCVRLARDHASRRRVRAGTDGIAVDRMNRLYVAEPTPTITGAAADHRLALPRSLVPAFAAALAAATGLELGDAAVEAALAALPADARHWLAPVAADLQQHRGAGCVLVGPAAPPTVHALVFALNAHLGNVGRTVDARPTNAALGGVAPDSLADLASALQAGDVTDLVLLDVDPAYDAPADLELATRIAQAPFSLHLGRYRDETARVCRWHVPARHPFEDWGDARAHDGTASIVQPLIAPLRGGRSPLEITARLRGEPLQTPVEIVRAHWRETTRPAAFDLWWRRTLHDGVVADSRPQPLSLALDMSAVRRAWSDGQARDRGAARSGDDALELTLLPDPTLWDGRLANVGWLQELPKPQTTLTWRNALLMAPATAQRLGVRNEDVVRVKDGVREVTAPVWIQPGQHERSLVLTLGYGRRHVGRLADDRGTDAYAMRVTADPWLVPAVAVAATGEKQRLVVRQNHQLMEGRDLVREGTTREFTRDPRHLGHPDPLPDLTSLYPDYPYEEGQQWGMVIDLSACIGCGVCTIACQAENNIPIVGEHQVWMGREMHWIRVDRYFHGPPARPQIRFQPVPCMQCEKAPCELVCPTGATQHSKDGLNEMIYNRCIGTRYCSNNCPYKVRRFNFLQFIAPELESIKLQRNPDVTVRGRGVMEKCTYCVQRIREADILARREKRAIRDGEIVTACQAACPTEAIVFGDINDENAHVAQARREPHEYKLLEELDTRPRTSYLAAVRNPNPDLEEERS